MLPSSDADVVQRDRALPGLATLLEPSRLAALLHERVPDLPLLPLRSTYLRYKPGVSCVAGFQFEHNGQVVDLYGVAYQPHSIKLAKYNSRLGEPGAFGLTQMVLADLALAVVFFPNDTKLKALSKLGPELLQKLLPHHPQFWRSHMQRLRYKPTRRYVARLDGADGSHALLKCYAEGDYRSARINASAFASTDLLRIATPLAVSDRRRILVSEWLPGVGLDARLADAPLRDLETVGRALAQLHAQRDAQVTSVVHTPGLASIHAALAVADIHPKLGAQARALGEQIADRLSKALAKLVPIHGDCYAGQMLLDGERVAIVDFDQACYGDAAADVGNCLAHFERDVIRGRLSPERVAALSDALLTGYQSEGGTFAPELLALYTAASLLQLAPHPFRERDPQWPEQTAALLERAAELLKDAKRTVAAPSAPPTVSDPFAVVRDSEMPWFGQVLKPAVIEPKLAELLRGSAHADAGPLRAIRVTRHKLGRRAVVEYELGQDAVEPLTLVGKVRARGLKRSAYAQLEALWRAGLHEDNPQQVCIAEPIGVLPEFAMTLQRKVPGVLATELLETSAAVAVSERIAEAAFCLHSAAVTPRREHRINDELAILRERLSTLANEQPRLAQRLERVWRECMQQASELAPVRPVGIHRDFYPDQLLIDGERVYVLDLDLYCLGDPALDIGNVLGHIQEQSLRRFGDPEALVESEAALAWRYVELSGDLSRLAVIEVYKTLTLARLIAISTLHAERRPFTEALLELCEQRLATASTLR